MLNHLNFFQFDIVAWLNKRKLAANNYEQIIDLVCPLVVQHSDIHIAIGSNVSGPA
jgi:predicted nucleotidyltransferase